MKERTCETCQWLEVMEETGWPYCDNPKRTCSGITYERTMGTCGKDGLLWQPRTTMSIKID